MSRWRIWTGRVLAVLAVLLVILSFLPQWQTDRWWVRQWDYPRLQVAGLLLLALIALPFFVERGRRFWAIMAAGLAALGWQLSHFVAYQPLYPKQVASASSCTPDRALSLLNANVLMTNKEYGRTIEMIERLKPDVVALPEADVEWEKALSTVLPDYRFRMAEATPNTYGLIFLSRLPVEGRVEHKLQPGVPSIRALVTLRGGQRVALHILHPEPPWPGDDSGERDAELVVTGKIVRKEGRAAIVIGDLNDVAWSRTSKLFRKVAGMGDPRVGRGFYPTFTAQYPLLRWPLDHLFVSPHFELTGIDVLPDIGSDHFPIMFRLCLKDDARERKVSPNVSAETAAEAGEEVSEGKVERAVENHGR
jgi:endonuclease/exonuclease/phosphatase (EEP) superfamily protein YafD